MPMRRRLYIAIGGDGFPRDKLRPGFEATIQVLNAMGLINFHEFHWRICGADVKEKGPEVWKYLIHLCAEVAAIESAGGVEIDGTFYEVRFRFKSDMALLLYAGDDQRALAYLRLANLHALPHAFVCVALCLRRKDGQCQLYHRGAAVC